MTKRFTTVILREQQRLKNLIPAVILPVPLGFVPAGNEALAEVKNLTSNI
jgi:hypothetical protein